MTDAVKEMLRRDREVVRHGAEALARIVGCADPSLYLMPALLAAVWSERARCAALVEALAEAGKQPVEGYACCLEVAALIRGALPLDWPARVPT